MKTLLLNPPSGFEGKFVSREQCGIGLVEEKFLPSEIFLSAAYLQKLGHNVEVVDLDQSDLDFSRYEVAVVWVCVLHTFHRDIQWLRRAKESGCRTVMILNDAYKEFETDTMQQYSFIDAAVRLWERELSLQALLNSWVKGVLVDYPGLIIRNHGRLMDTGMHPKNNDLSHLASCSQQLSKQPLSRYRVAGITPGRGCTAGCGFCLYANTAQRKRAIEDVLDEVETVADRIKKIHLLDPDLPSTRKWIEKFCLELIKRRLSIHWCADLRPEDAEPELLRLFRQSGCEELLVGVETLEPAIKKKVGAGQTAQKLRNSIQIIRNAGIKPVLIFYVGLPWDNVQSLGKIKKFLHEVPVASFYLKQVRPWPGTTIHDAFRSLGLMKRKLTVQEFINSGAPLCPTLHLSKDEIEEWKKRIGRAGIMQAEYILRFLRERRIRPKHVSQLVSLLLGRNIFRGK